MRDRYGRFTKGHNQRKTHGMTYTNFYTRYSSMKERCENPKSTGYHLWGGRGIKVFWKSFEEFRNDMYDSFVKHVKLYGIKNTSLDRINGKDSYYKKNCHWVSKKMQARNISSNRIISYKGKSFCISKWAEIIGCNPGAFYARVERGWSINRIFTQPFRKKY